MLKLVKKQSIYKKSETVFPDLLFLILLELFHISLSSDYLLFKLIYLFYRSKNINV